MDSIISLIGLLAPIYYAIAIISAVIDGVQFTISRLSRQRRDS